MLTIDMFFQTSNFTSFNTFSPHDTVLWRYFVCVWGGGGVVCDTGLKKG